MHRSVMQDSGMPLNAHRALKIVMSSEVETSLTVPQRNNDERFDSFVSQLTRRYPRGFTVHVARPARSILDFVSLLRNSAQNDKG